LDLLHLLLRELALERGVAALDLRDVARDLVVGRDRLGSDRLALGVEAADEADLLEEVLGGVGDEIEDGVLLSNLGGQHGWALAMARGYQPPPTPTFVLVIVIVRSGNAPARERSPGRREDLSS